MLVTHQKIVDYFKDESNLFFIWTEDDCFIPNGTFATVEYMSMFIAISGTITIESEQFMKEAGRQNLQFYLPGTKMRIVSVTEDYRSIGIIYSPYFWEKYLVHTHPYTLLAQIYSCLNLRETDRSDMLGFFTFLAYARKSGKEDQNPVMLSLLKGIYSLAGKCYERWIADYTNASKVKLIAEFSRLVYTHYRSHRDVLFYANELNVSVTYFSQIFKYLTGITPYRCIEKFIILKVCDELVESDKCIKEIAFEFRFEDTSHFCKYFKKNMGISPHEFRQRRRNMTDNSFIL